MNFGAVLLAGGKSTRMGSEKALLPIDGQLLWQRQVSVLREAGAGETVISSNQLEIFTGSGFVVVPDMVMDCGPLAGIAAGLAAISAPWVLVLAVDMPAVTADFLRSLVLGAIGRQTAIVPRHSSGHWEPLAAVYPKAAAGLAARLLSEGRRKMQEFIAALAGEQSLEERSILSEEVRLFENWNAPGDLRAGR